MKSTKGFFWYERDGSTLHKKVETDCRIIWKRLMEFYNGDWQRATKDYRFYLDMTNENIHKIR